MFALAKVIKKFCGAFSKATEGTGRVALYSALSFDSFSLGLFLQRKAAKGLCCKDLLDAFSFATRGTKEKALQKENAIFALTPRGRPLLKKRCKTLALVCANIPINPNLTASKSIWAACFIAGRPKFFSLFEFLDVLDILVIALFCTLLHLQKHFIA